MQSPGASHPGSAQPPVPPATQAVEQGAAAGDAETQSASSQDPPSIRASITAFLQDLRGLMGDHVQLVALELKRVRRSMVRLVVFGVAGAILMATAWIALWAMLVAIIVEAGGASYIAVGIVLILNGIGAWFALKRAEAMVANLSLPATIRRLHFAPAPSTPPGASRPKAGESAS